MYKYFNITLSFVVQFHLLKSKFLFSDINSIWFIVRCTYVKGSYVVYNFYFPHFPPGVLLETWSKFSMVIASLTSSDQSVPVSHKLVTFKPLSVDLRCVNFMISLNLKLCKLPLSAL